MRAAFLVALILVSMPTLGQTSLKSLQDRSRVLLIFASNGQDDRFRTQLARLDGKQMAERDLILVPVLEKWDKLDGDLRTAHAPYTSDVEQAAAHRRFRIPPSAFIVILLGKDGTEKFRAPTPITMTKLSQIIDSMPMRQQEMQSRNPW